MTENYEEIIGAIKKFDPFIQPSQIKEVLYPYGDNYTLITISPNPVVYFEEERSNRIFIGSCGNITGEIKDGEIKGSMCLKNLMGTNPLNYLKGNEFLGKWIGAYTNYHKSYPVFSWPYKNLTTDNEKMEENLKEMGIEFVDFPSSVLQPDIKQIIKSIGFFNNEIRAKGIDIGERDSFLLTLNDNEDKLRRKYRTTTYQ